MILLNKYEKVTKLFTLLNFLIFFGCATNDVFPPFESSNQHFIDNTINKLNIGAELNNIIDSSKNIILLPLEENQPSNKSISIMIEDQIISSLYNSGYTVLEREKNAINQLIKEGEEYFYLTFSIPHKNLNYNEIKGDVIEPDIKFIKTHLKSADLAIFYRILEIGIIYLDHPDEKEYKKRESLIRIHLRVQDISNGKIIYANNITSKSSDIVETKYIDYLSSFHYSFFSYKYPIQESVNK